MYFIARDATVQMSAMKERTLKFISRCYTHSRSYQLSSSVAFGPPPTLVNFRLDTCVSSISSAGHKRVISAAHLPSGCRSSRPWKLSMVAACECKSAARSW